MSKAVALIIVLFLGLFSGHCYGQLRVGFYKGIKCGQKDVEGVVREVVKSWRFTKDKTIAAALLRMQFHDCFVNVRILSLQFLLLLLHLFYAYSCKRAEADPKFYAA